MRDIVDTKAYLIIIMQHGRVKMIISRFRNRLENKKKISHDVNYVS